MYVGQTIGPFEIQRELGSGAMGTVYQAKFQKDTKQVLVALKVVALGLLGNDSAMARFDREANILKQLKHPNIVRLIATGRYQKTPFIAMEFIDGESMDRTLARRGKLSWEDIIHFGQQLCAALQYAHDKGIIHRDLKPSNLMITEDGTLKLTDFGIAKDTDVTALTGANSTIGTAAYMSPEQCKGERNLSAKSDLYSLGVVFYELVTGRKPFVAENTIDMFMKHVKDKPVRPSRLQSDLPVWLDNLILFLLEKDPNSRPLDAATVGRLLAEIEQKVQSQQSAAADVANARRIDRKLGDVELDAKDIEAARSLRGKSKKSKKPKKGTPWYEQTWLRALPIVIALVALIGGGIVLLRPASQEDMFQAVMNAPTPESKKRLAEDYLQRFGTKTDEKTQQVQGIIKEARGQRLESILDKRFRNKDGALRMTKPEAGEDPDSHAAAWGALEAEEKGDLLAAIAQWTKCKTAGEIAIDNYTDGWVWLAEKHLSTIQSLDKLLAQTKEQLAKALSIEAVLSSDVSQPENLGQRAIRYQGNPTTTSTSGSGGQRQLLPFVNDPALARKNWSNLMEMTKNKPDQRAWFLLAGREREKISEQKVEPALIERRAMLTALLAAIQTEWTAVKGNADAAAAQRDCRNRLRVIQQLYSDESDETVKKTVAAATALLNTMKP
ncbi:MAG: serine/threonine protein kinase [Gemmataceae bacterium]